ncbi:MAG: hypothetical protein LC799_04715, partial [Actinobacteria bacterium]|nr:hypothetical protein [Actinomycetota bacterium]
HELGGSDQRQRSPPPHCGRRFLNCHLIAPYPHGVYDAGAAEALRGRNRVGLAVGPVRTSPDTRVTYRYP